MVRFFKKSFSPDCEAAAKSLLRDGLSLSPGDKLVLLYQNELSEVAKCISSVAKPNRIVVDSRQFDVNTFSNEYPASCSVSNLSVPPIPSGIVLLMEWSERSTKARLALLRDLVGVQKGWRIASMPGVDLDNFGLCVSDFSDVREKCEITFALLARSKMAILETRNANGTIDTLKIPIGSYRPENSTGKIPKNSWGNFPSGETFIVPNPYQAEGWVTVRGSIPKRPLAASEWIRYRLGSGRIIHDSVEASSSDLSIQFKGLCFTANGEPKDENTNALAELGIGTNASITRLTGNPIFDEKQLGTVHIAFGRNDQFKGPLVSTVHHDIVCTGATLSLEGQFTHPMFQSAKLVANGTFSATQADALPKIDSFPPYDQQTSTLTLGKTDYNFQPTNPTDSNSLEMTIEYVSERENMQFVIGRGRQAELARLLLQGVQFSGSISPQTLIQRCEAAEQGLGLKIITALLVYGVLDANVIAT